MGRQTGRSAGRARAVVLAVLVATVLSQAGCSTHPPIQVPEAATPTSVSSAQVSPGTAAASASTAASANSTGTPSATAAVIPGTSVVALDAPIPTAEQAVLIAQRLRRSGFAAGSDNGCAYLTVLGWSETGMDIVSGLLATGPTTPDCADGFAKYQIFRDGHEVLAVEAAEGSAAADFDRLETFFSGRPALDVSQGENGWIFTRTTQ